MSELELIYELMDTCDGDVHLAIERAAQKLDATTEELYEIYDNQ